jgi:uncharacterized membrane protein
MSRTIYWVLGSAAILCSGLLTLQLPEVLARNPPESQLKVWIGFLGFLGLCVTIAIACFFPRSYPVTLRILGVVGLAGVIFTLTEHWRDRNLTGMTIAVLFWLPGSLYLIYKGDLGRFNP